MPRIAPAEAKEFRFTLGDYERREIIKPIGQLLEETNSAIKTTKYLGYAAVAGGIVGAWFIGKGIAGVWDDVKNIIPSSGASAYEWVADFFGGVNKEAYQPIDPNDPWGANS